MIIWEVYEQQFEENRCANKFNVHYSDVLHLHKVSPFKNHIIA